MPHFPMLCSTLSCSRSPVFSSLLPESALSLSSTRMYVAAMGELSSQSNLSESKLINFQIRGRILSSPPKHPLVYHEDLGFVPALPLPTSYVSSHLDSNYQCQWYRQLPGLHVSSDALLRQADSHEPIRSLRHLEPSPWLANPCSSIRQ